VIGGRMRSKVVAFFEGFIIFAILLVLVQTFLEDFAVLIDWSWEIRRALIFAGFAFDLLFTVEFLVRLFYAFLDRRVKDYIVHQRGWVDFAASIPLLMLNSGPTALAIIAGGTFLGLGGILNVLKVIKAIRIARILRLLRVLKIFRQIKYADSPMAQRHVSKVTSISISVFVFGLLVITLIAGPLGIPSVDKVFDAQHEAAFTLIADEAEKGNIETAANIAENEADVLLVKSDNKVIFSRLSQDLAPEDFGPGEYSYMGKGAVEVYFSLQGLARYQAKDNLIYFVIIIILVIVFLVYYSPHFAITISDPIHVMKRGFEESSYNLEVKIPKQYKEDDVFRLAAMYNEVFLPMKDRSASEEGSEMVDLQIDDFDDLFDEGT